MANTNRTPTVGALTAAGVASAKYSGLPSRSGVLTFSGYVSHLIRGQLGTLGLGELVTIATGRRPGLAWSEGLTGAVVSIPRGGALRVRPIDAAGRVRSVR